MDYRCVTTSVRGFVQQLLCYLQDTYWCYRPGYILTDEDPQHVDQTVLCRYGIGASRWWRARRRSVGIASLHYLRHHRYYLLLATKGHHPFYDQQQEVHDVRQRPIRFSGYSIGVVPGRRRRRRTDARVAVPTRRWQVHVELCGQTYRALESYFLDMATGCDELQLQQEFDQVPFEAYGPVRRQMLDILAQVNRARELAGLEPLGPKVLRRCRRIVNPFETGQFDDAA